MAQHDTLPSGSNQADAFALFLELPIELQREIWKFAASDIVKHTEQRWFWSVEHTSSSGESDESSFLTIKYTGPHTDKLVSIFRVCSLARTITIDEVIKEHCRYLPRHQIPWTGHLWLEFRGWLYDFRRDWKRCLEMEWSMTRKLCEMSNYLLATHDSMVPST